MVRSQAIVVAVVALLAGGAGYATATYRLSATATAVCPEPAHHGPLPPAGMPAEMPKGTTW